MSANYVQKINNNAIAASETVPSSNLATTLAGKEEVSNKKQSIDDTSTIEYPSSKAVADFVNSSVSTATATYRGNYNVVSDLSLTYDASELQIATALISAISTTPDNNDYCFVQIPTATATPTIIDHVDRYKFDGTNWAYEYTLNNSGFTAAEWAAIQSGITSSDKTTWNNHISNTTVHVTSSDKTTWNNKQDSLGIDSTSGDTTKVLNEKGQFVVPSLAAITYNARSIVIENYLQIEIQRGNNHRHASITIFGDNGSYPFIANIGFQFLTSPGSGESAGFQTPPVLSMVECNNLSSNAYVPDVWYINNGSSGSSYIYCKWSSNKRLTVLLNTFAPAAIVLSDVASLPSGAVAAGKGHSLPHITGINTQVGSPTVPVYVSPAGELVPATGVGHVAYEYNNEINYVNVPTSGNKDRHWFNYRNGDTGSQDSSNTLSDYYFGNRNGTTNDVYLHADGFAPRIVNGTNSNVLPFVKIVCTNTGTNKGFIHFKCVFLGTNNDDGMGHVDITVKIRQNSWHVLASKCVRIGGGGALNYGSAGNLIYWESGSNVYLGLRPTSYNAKISVYVQYCELNNTATYTIGNFNSEVANLTIHEGDTRDVSKALGLYDSADNKYMMQFAFNPNTIGNNANAPDTKTYWENLPTTTDNSGCFNCIYNNKDTEYSLIASKSSSTSNNETHSWGNVIRWSYWSPTLEILRCWRDNWRTDDWEPIAQPSVLCFTYTDTSSGMASLFAALCKCINHTMGGSSSEIRYDMTVLYKGGYFYPLIYFNKAGSGGNYQYMWRFANTGVYGINMITQLVFTVVVPSSGTTTYSWSTESETRWKQQVGSIGTDPQTIYFT